MLLKCKQSNHFKMFLYQIIDHPVYCNLVVWKYETETYLICVHFYFLFYVSYIIITTYVCVPV